MSHFIDVFQDCKSYRVRDDKVESSFIRNHQTSCKEESGIYSFINNTKTLFASFTLSLAYSGVLHQLHVV